MFKTSGAFRERIRNAWAEMGENLGRSTLQSLGVMLGVASVLGGFSITDSMRQRSADLYRKLGGLDKLNIQPSAVVSDGTPTAMQAANLGLRHLDATEGGTLGDEVIDGVSIQKRGAARIRSAYADQERQIVGIGLDFLPIDGYAVAQGRAFSAADLERAAPLVILGSEAAMEFFPDGQALGSTLRIGDEPVTVVGVLEERVFRFRKSHRNWFRWRNRLIFVPA
ncbi:MAG TPA: ABC transporter permease, partial [Thermoanaerobaculia bacterium]